MSQQVGTIPFSPGKRFFLQMGQANDDHDPRILGQMTVEGGRDQMIVTTREIDFRGAEPASIGRDGQVRV